MDDGYIFVPLDSGKSADIVRALGGAADYRTGKRADVVRAEGVAVVIQPAKTQAAEKPSEKPETKGDRDAATEAKPGKREQTPAAEPEDSRVIMFPERKPPEKPVKVQNSINTEPIAKEIGKLATIMRVTLQAQAETISRLAGEKQQRGTETEIWDFEVVERDQFGRIAKMRTQRSSEPCH